jgi:cytochrome c2
LGGCAVLALCVLLACAASAVYWFTTLRTTGAAREPAADVIRAELKLLPAGDAASGEQILTVVQPCHTCHIDVPVGPPFPGEPPLATLAATRRPDYSAEAYLYESIVNPSAYVVPGFQGDIMPENFGGILTQQDLADLVAYLMTMQ